jgi:MATE family multidrug resistance protein
MKRGIGIPDSTSDHPGAPRVGAVHNRKVDGTLHREECPLLGNELIVPLLPVGGCVGEILFTTMVDPRPGQAGRLRPEFDVPGSGLVGDFRDDRCDVDVFRFDLDRQRLPWLNVEPGKGNSGKTLKGGTEIHGFILARRRRSLYTRPTVHAPYRATISRILRIGTPLLAGNLSMYLYRLADSIMIGRLGVGPLAAIAVATVYTAVHEMFIWPTALGTQAITSRRYGRSGYRRDQPSVREILPQAVFAGIIAGSAAFLLSLAAGTVVPLFAAAQAEEATAYVRISRIAFPLMGIASGLRGYLAAVHRTRIVMTGIVVSNVANVALNAVFIFGLGPAPALGVQGAAIGTVAAHGINAAILIAAVMITRPTRPVSLLPERRTIIRILTIGAPTAVQNAFAMAMILAYQWILGSIGAVYQAVTHVLFSSFRLNKTLVGGFANGASILVGNALGRDDHEGAVSIVQSQQLIAGGIGTLVFVLALAFPGSVAEIFALTGAARSILVSGLRFFAFFFLVEVLAYSLEIIFTHNGSGRFVLMSEVSSNLSGIIGVSALAVFVLGWGYRGAWIGFAVYQVVHAGILWGGFRSRRWLTAPVDGESSPAESGTTTDAPREISTGDHRGVGADA